MFVGHFALGFAAKRAAPSVSLGILFTACQLADLLWPVFVLTGLERVEIEPGATRVTPLAFVSYPYSHSLLALCIWALAFVLVFARKHAPALRTGLILGGLVLSHWVLDVITHRPDMPLGFHDSTRLGLGLWNSRAGTLAVELSMFAGGVFTYVRCTRATDRTGRFALLGLCAFLLIVNLANFLGPPPPSSTAVAATALSMWLLIAWGYLIDRHRSRKVLPEARRPNHPGS